MNINETEKLLEKYYEGQTTLDEERRLREFFLTEFVPPHLTVHAELFRTIASSKEEELPDPDFERKFMQAISTVPVIKHPAVNRKLIYITSLAACLLILAGLFFLFRPATVKTDPEMEIAFAETQKALLLLSGNFNTGLEQMGKLKTFDEGMTKVQNFSRFNDGVEKAEKLSEFYKYQTINIKP